MFIQKNDIKKYEYFFIYFQMQHYNFLQNNFFFSLKQ